MAAEMLQELDLAQSALGKDLLAEDIGNFLDGDSFLSRIVDGGTTWTQWLLVSIANRACSPPFMENPPDNAVSSLAELLRDGVPFVHDEVLVEHLEHLAPLYVPHVCCKSLIS
jgi:hypothetical protein